MATATQTSKILSAEQEAKLRQPIDEYVGKIQAQIDELRTDGTEKAVNIQNELDNLKRDRIYTAQEKTERETKLKAELAAAKAVEEKNKGQINKLIARGPLRARSWKWPAPAGRKWRCRDLKECCGYPELPHLWEK